MESSLQWRASHERERQGHLRKRQQCLCRPWPARLDSQFLNAQLVAKLYCLTQQRKLTQTKAGERAGISQPEVSRPFKGNFREYSIERLMAFLTAFDCDIEIVSRPRIHHKGRGHISFSAVGA